MLELFVPRVWVAIVAVATLVATHGGAEGCGKRTSHPVIPLLIGERAAV